MIQLRRGLLLKMLKYLEVMFTVFEFFRVKETIERVFMKHPIMFLDRENKTKLVPESFSYFLKLL